MSKYIWTALIMTLSTTIYAQTAEDVVRNIGVSTIEAIYDFDAEDDPNNQLGRPNQYIQKTSWADSRIDPHDFSDENEEEINDLDPVEYKGGTIEKFRNQADLNRRYTYIKNITLNAPIFNQYMYKKGLFLMRLDKAFSPAQAKVYEQKFNSVVK